MQSVSRRGKSRNFRGEKHVQKRWTCCQASNRFLVVYALLSTAAAAVFDDAVVAANDSHASYEMTTVPASLTFSPWMTKKGDSR